jgi:hypothetical protein
MKRILWITVSLTHLAASLPATADCIGPLPRYVEMRVESCVSAVPSAKSAVVDKDYSLRETEAVSTSAAYLYIIHAKVLADIDIIEWHSRDGLRRYKGRQKLIQSETRDYMVVSYVGCEQLAKGSALIFDIHENKPCRDSIAIINGQEAKETDAKLILDLPLVKYFPDQEEIEDIQNANKRLQVTCETHAPEAWRWAA